MFKTIFFDVDDTLLDFGYAERVAISEALKEIGIAPTNDTVALYSSINKACWERLERGEYTREQVLTERFRIFFEEIGASGDPERTRTMYEQRLAIGHYFVDGAEELLKKLCGKYKMYIVSNGTAAVQTARLNSSGITKYFDGIYISETVGAAKPSTEFFERVFADIGDFDRECAIIVGDSMTSDIPGGHNAGIKTCLFNPRNKKYESGVTPDYEIDSLDKLIQILEK